MDINKDINPAFKDNNIPICFSADDNYAPYLGVAIKSLIENSSFKNNYNIFILDDGITKQNQALILSLIENKNNFSITFINTNSFLGKIDKSIFKIHSHFAIPTYYRFFIPTIFSEFKKMIYLDCDIIILDDIAKLYETEIQDNILAAVKDIDLIRNLHTDEKYISKMYEYVAKDLRIKNPYNYFQAGVLLLNIQKMKEEDFQTKCIKKLKEIKSPKFVDQDILNCICEEKVYELDLSWNVEHHVPISSKILSKQLSEELKDNFLSAVSSPKIIHYTSSQKPWKNKDCKMADYFWKYAELTPFHSKLLQDINQNQTASKQTIFNFITYDILSRITFGKTKKYVLEKRNHLKKKLIN